MVFKVLLAPAWMVLFLLKWTSPIAIGIASEVLRLGEMLLFLIVFACLVVEFEPILTIRVFVVGFGALIATYISSA